jgi:hypothetical protein
VNDHDDAGTTPAPLDALTAAGFSVDALSDEQREVLCALTPEELSLLIDIRGRLDEAAPEVQAHADVAGGALF